MGIADKSKLDDDAICYLATIFGACLDVISSLTQDCIDGIHVVERKRSGSCKLLQMKLAFALEQMYSLAKLAYEVGCHGDNQENDPILFSVIQHCTRCIHAVLIDTNTQVRNLYACSIWTILCSIHHDQTGSWWEFLVCRFYRLGCKC